MVFKAQNATNFPEVNCVCIELRRPDSNERPPGYEPGELPTAPLRDVFLDFECKDSAFPRTAKQIADYFRENANVTVSLPVERPVSFVLQRWQAVIGPVQGYSLFDFLRRWPPV